MLEINSNGQRMPGDMPFTIEPLYKTLAEHILDPRFENYGGFVNRAPHWTNPDTAQRYSGCTVIKGDFLGYDHPFFIITDEEDIISKVEALVAENIKRPDYASAKATLPRCRNCVFYDAKKEICLLDKTYKNKDWDCQVGYVAGALSLMNVEGEREFVSRVILPEPTFHALTIEALSDDLMDTIMDDAGRPYSDIARDVARNAIFQWMTHGWLPNEEYEPFEKQLNGSFVAPRDALEYLAGLATEQLNMEVSAKVRESIPVEPLNALLIGTQSSLAGEDVLVALGDLLTFGPGEAQQCCGELLEQMDAVMADIESIRDQLMLVQ